MWIWDAVNGVRDLSTVLTNAGFDLTGWALTDVKGMSGDGLMLTGNGTFGGVTHAWVAVVPEPGAFIVLATGLIGLVGLRRKARWDLDSILKSIPPVVGIVQQPAARFRRGR